MKVIGNQLIDGIKLSERGEIKVDTTKINPYCMTIEDKNIEL